MTPSERAALEKQDKTWVEPPQTFLDLVEPLGVVYNRKTGFFELNTLVDISYSEMKLIYAHRMVLPSPKRFDHNDRTRTNLWVSNVLSEYDYHPELANMFRNNHIEIIKISTTNTHSTIPSIITGLIYRANMLHTILGVLDMQLISKPTTLFVNELPKLTTIKIKNVAVNLNIKWAPALSLESMEYLVGNAANTKPITITVHPDVYAKLMDEENSEWHAVTERANEKNIQFVTV